MRVHTLHAHKDTHTTFDQSQTNQRLACETTLRPLNVIYTKQADSRCRTPFGPTKPH